MKIFSIGAVLVACAVVLLQFADDGDEGYLAFTVFAGVGGIVLMCVGAVIVIWP